MTEIIFCIFIAYGGMFLTYMVTNAVAMIGFGYEIDATNEYMGLLLWCALFLWMIVLSIILLVRRHKTIKRIEQQINCDQQIISKKKKPFYWIGKRLALCIVELMSTPFLVILTHWGVEAMEKSSFINNSFIGEYLLFFVSMIGVGIYALPLVATYFAIFKKDNNSQTNKEKINITQK